MNLILNKFFPDCDWRTIDIKGKGMNNTTHFIEANGERYALRIYETHRDEDKVKYEHAVLLNLGERDKPFQTPVPVRSANGNTIVRTEDGKLAALFRYLEGCNPSLDSAAQLYGFGKAAAQLSAILSDVEIGQAPVYRPYYEIESTHPRCSLDEVARFCLKPPEVFSTDTRVVHALQELGAVLGDFRSKFQVLKKLPHQLVHGDLNASNVLADANGRISAILDFEFITRDLRVMELAVCLSDMIHPDRDEEEMWKKIDALLEGYGSSMKLTSIEIESLPLLLLLRRLDVFIHFLGRYWDGIDGANVVADQIVGAYLMKKWLDMHGDGLLAILHNRIAE